MTMSSSFSNSVSESTPNLTERGTSAVGLWTSLRLQQDGPRSWPCVRLISNTTNGIVGRFLFCRSLAVIWVTLRKCRQQKTLRIELGLFKCIILKQSDINSPTKRLLKNENNGKLHVNIDILISTP